jgi:hypothetical protein
VLLITIAGAMLSTMFHALSAGSALRLAALAVFGLFGAREIHHLFEAVASASYPGVITAFAYFWCGGRLLGGVWGVDRRGILPAAGGVTRRHTGE